MNDPDLQQWLDECLPLIPAGKDYAFRVATDAWVAATQDTLSFVAKELHRKADNTVISRDAVCLRNVADLIKKMKP